MINHTKWPLIVIAIFCVAFMVTNAVAASPLLVHMGNDKTLDWSWDKTAQLKGAIYRLVDSKETANTVAKQLPPCKERDLLQSLDYSRQVALVAYLGQAPNAGYAVDIHSVQIWGNEILVNISRRSPGPDEAIAAVITHPLVVKTLPASDLPQASFTVRYLDQGGKQIAEQAVKRASAVKSTTYFLGDNDALKWEWHDKRPPADSNYSWVNSRKAARRLTRTLPRALRTDAFKHVDFRKQVALMAYLGEVPNDGYAVDIHSVQVEEGKVLVRVARRSPAPGELNKRATTYPLAIVPVSRKALPARPFTVQFVDQSGQLLAERQLR
mgnify:CR=1 FL=1